MKEDYETDKDRCWKTVQRRLMMCLPYGCDTEIRWFKCAALTLQNFYLRAEKKTRRRKVRIKGEDRETLRRSVTAQWGLRCWCSPPLPLWPGTCIFRALILVHTRGSTFKHIIHFLSKNCWSDLEAIGVIWKAQVSSSSGCIVAWYWIRSDWVTDQNVRRVWSTPARLKRQKKYPKFKVV